jgi:hypothetical protein
VEFQIEDSTYDQGWSKKFGCIFDVCTDSFHDTSLFQEASLRREIDLQVNNRDKEIAMIVDELDESVRLLGPFSFPPVSVSPPQPQSSHDVHIDLAPAPVFSSPLQQQSSLHLPYVPPPVPKSDLPRQQHEVLTVVSPAPLSFLAPEEPASPLFAVASHVNHVEHIGAVSQGKIIQSNCALSPPEIPDPITIKLPNWYCKTLKGKTVSHLYFNNHCSRFLSSPKGGI